MVRTNFCSVKVLLVSSLALLVIFIAVVVLGFVALPLLITNQLEKNVKLEDGTVQWDRFVELPFGLDFKVWMYNVTNPDEIMRGAIPILKEIGPYHYNYFYMGEWKNGNAELHPIVENIKKNILNIDENDDTVTYKRNLTLLFDKDLSGDLREDDELILLNPVMLSMSQITSALERMVLEGCIDKILPPEYYKIFIKIKVRTVLFEGIEFANQNDDIGVACSIVRKKVLEKTSKIRNVAKVFASSDSEEISSLKFALFDYKVSRDDGIYSVYRGLDDISLLGTIARWNESTEMTYWGRSVSVNNETCNQVRGTDSTVYHPHIDKDDYFEIFATDICRLVKITYQGKDSYKGVDAYRFAVNENTFRSATPSPENDCYCSMQTANEYGTSSCFLDGLIDLQPCIGAPILLSFPHFLYADEKYLNAVSGLDEPDESIHRTYLLVEPNTGTPLEGRKRVQFNLVLRPVGFLTITQNLPQVVVPYFWVEEGVSLPQEYIDELNDKFFDILKIANGVKYGLIAVTLAAVLTTTGFLIRKQFFTGK